MKYFSGHCQGLHPGRKTFHVVKSNLMILQNQCQMIKEANDSFKTLSLTFGAAHFT